MTDTIPTFRHTDHAATWASSPERTPLFAVVRFIEDAEGGGHEETIEYTMPAKPNPGLALDFLRRMRREGELAMAWLIETAVGEEGYDALVEDLADTEGADALDTLKAIVAKIQKVAMGGLEAGPKG